MIWDAFKNPAGNFTLSGLSALGNAQVRGYFIGSFKLSLISALVGAVFGAILAYAVASGNPDGVIRRLYLSASGVLAQFGGVTLAFAFLALIGPAPTGLLFHASWYYSFPWGITVIYAYFQIPLMVLVFLPAIDGLKIQWREASESLGSSAWQYWRYIGGPLLLPAFLGALLLLFANALSAFATIQAWENQIAYTVAAADLYLDVQRGRSGQHQLRRRPGARHGGPGRHRHDRLRLAAAAGGAMAAITSIGETPHGRAGQAPGRACRAGGAGG